MVKGIRLKEPPGMDKVSEVDILGEIDVLEEVRDQIPADGFEVKTRIFDGYKFHTIVTEYTDPDAIDSVMTVASTLETAAPELVKVFLWDGNKVVFSFPSMRGDPSKRNIFIQIVDELLRVATFVISEFNSGEVTSPDPIERLKKYIQLYIKW